MDECKACLSMRLRQDFKDPFNNFRTVNTENVANLSELLMEWSFE
jgi:hypothetical protein